MSAFMKGAICDIISPLNVIGLRCVLHHNKPDTCTSSAAFWCNEYWTSTEVQDMPNKSNLPNSILTACESYQLFVNTALFGVALMAEKNECTWLQTAETKQSFMEYDSCQHNANKAFELSNQNKKLRKKKKLNEKKSQVLSETTFITSKQWFMM